jgi:3',5'-cyclic AMP phosphodiesterase CpdA
MPEFRLTQISDTHLTRRHQNLTDNFYRVSKYIDATRPDLVVNSGDFAWDPPTAGFFIPDHKQEVIGSKEVGLVEYRFQPDTFEVRHVRAPGQIDVDLDVLLRPS